MAPSDNGRRVELNAREIVDIVTDAYSAERAAMFARRNAGSR